MCNRDNMDKKEIIEVLKEVREDLDTIVAFMENPDLLRGTPFGADTVNERLGLYRHDPAILADAMTALYEKYGSMSMIDMTEET